MRVVGQSKQRGITYAASGRQLAEGARFNDETHRLPTGARTAIPKGVYRFRSFEDSNRHDLECVVAYMLQVAAEKG